MSVSHMWEFSSNDESIFWNCCLPILNKLYAQQNLHNWIYSLFDGQFNVSIRNWINYIYQLNRNDWRMPEQFYNTYMCYVKVYLESKAKQCDLLAILLDLKSKWFYLGKVLLPLIVLWIVCNWMMDFLFAIVVKKSENS